MTILFKVLARMKNLLFFAIYLCIGGCVNSEQSDEAKLSTLVYCSEGSPSSFDPHTVTSGTSVDASARQIYNRLVAFKPGTVEIVPSLAKSWRTNRKGTRYTFYLRDDVSFHTTEHFTPTRKLNGEDILFSFERQSSSEHPYHYVGNRNYPYFNSQGLNTLIKEINLLDSHTVEFVLTKPSSPFLTILAMEFTSILSAEYAKQLLIQNTPEKIINYPVGTGPFKLKRYQADAFIRYRAHANYFLGKPKIEHLVFAITTDPSLRFARVTAGECDVMNNPLPIHLTALANQSNIEVIEDPGLNVAYWSFNTRKPPFDDVRVRQAMNYAVDRDSIMKAVYYGSAEVAKNPIPPNMWSYNNAIKDYPHDPEKAKQLLSEAGYPNGFYTNIWVFPEQRTYNPNAPKMAELIQQDLKNIGVKAEIVSYEVGTFLKRVRAGEHETSLQGWVADNGDPDNFFGTLLSCKAAIPGQNSAFWCDLEFDAIIRDAHSITNRKKRATLYKEAQQIFKRQAPWLTIAHTKQYLIINKRVKNLQQSPSGGIFFADVQLLAGKKPIKASTKNKTGVRMKKAASL